MKGRAWARRCPKGRPQIGGTGGEISIVSHDTVRRGMSAHPGRLLTSKSAGQLSAKL